MINVPQIGGTLPVYNLAAVAHAVDLPPKQLDNLLSRSKLPRVEKKRRGSARRFPPDIAVVVKLASDLGTALGIPPGKLLSLASAISRGDHRSLAIGNFAKLDVDLPALRMAISTRLDEAVEVMGRVPRGRPPAQR